ncbi:hypothetical protein L208DRAFT_1252630 [Tricholoma matsutake]|nr:hypothetical protein L208DRAFT_1252630 [Tricholoma matsutake 945]
MLQSSEEFKLTITPVKVTALPSEEAIIAAGQHIIQTTSSWKPGKTYHHKVKTFRRGKLPEDGAPWHCRVSEHTAQDASFDQLWEKLGTVKEAHEKEFIHNIRSATKVKDLSPTAAIWTMCYTFTPPVSPRVFTVLKVSHLDETTPRTGIVVSIPVDLSVPESEDLLKFEESGVKGRYVSIERFVELEGGKTEWRMATSSTPGGNIPAFLSEGMMDDRIAQDVPLFLKWLHKKVGAAEA